MWPYPSWKSVKSKAKEKYASVKKELSYQKAKIKYDLSKAGEKTGFDKVGKWAEKVVGKISSGIDFKVSNPENVNEGISKKGKGNKETEVAIIDVMKDLLNVHGPDTNLPGTDLTNANPEGNSNTTSNEATINETSTAEKEKTNIRIPKSTFGVYGNNSKSATLYHKDTVVNTSDAETVLEEAISADKEKTDKFNEKYGTNFKRKE